MEIFKLVGSIMVDSAEARDSISKTGSEAESLGEKLSQGITTAGKWAAGIVAGAAAVGAAMVSATKKTAANLEAIDKGSQRMKISTKAYQELSFVADQTGVSMETLERAAKKLEQTGSDLDINQAINALSHLRTENERNEAAAEMFGESLAYQLTPLMNVGIKGIHDMRTEASELGLIMSDDAVAAGAAMGDSISKVEQTVAALRDQFVVKLMPYAQDFLDWLLDRAPSILDKVAESIDWVTNAAQVAADAIGILWNAFQTGTQITGAMAAGGSIDAAINGPSTIVVQSVLDGQIVGESVTAYQAEILRAMG